MIRPVLVRDLAIEGWRAMDRYAVALESRTPEAIVPGAWKRLRGPRYFTRYCHYPLALRGVGGDVVHILDHSYAHCLVAFPGRPSVVTVHDLYPVHVLLERRRTLRARARDALLRWVLGNLRRADRFIVGTRFVGEEVCRLLDVPAGRLAVIPFGVDALFFSRPDPDRTAARRRTWLSELGAGADARVLLHVGSCLPRKNVGTAIRAVGALRRRGLEAVLVQVGGRFSRAQRAAIAAEGRPFVLQVPNVTDAELLESYSAADVLVLPSRYEGYGFPALEAMAAGLPVVTSGAGGNAEAVGDAALVTGDVGPDRLAEMLGGLLEDRRRREELIARGTARAARHTWDDAAAMTRAVYERLVAQR